MRQAATSDATAGITWTTTMAMSSCDGARANPRTASAIRVAGRCELIAGQCAVAVEREQCEERSLRERPDLSSSQPPRTTVSGPTIRRGRSISLIRRTFPAISASVKVMSSTGFGRARSAPSRKRPFPAYSA